LCYFRPSECATNIYIDIYIYIYRYIYIYIYIYIVRQWTRGIGE
jgi:hypothetical protein